VETLGSERAYRILLALLIVAGFFFGLAPFLLPETFASLTGFKGTDVFVYRIAGAATLGYGVGLAVGWRAPWAEMRIPFIATFVFNLCSIGACLAAIVAGGAPWIVFVILLASALFFGAASLVLAGEFGKILGAPGNDDFIYRQAGSATMGAGIGGIFVLRARRWEAARIPTIMALVFNGASVIAALLQIGVKAYPVTWLILAAAGLVTVGTALALVRKGK
jgi:uncharacterized protein (DUF983 family)